MRQIKQQVERANSAGQIARALLYVTCGVNVLNILSLGAVMVTPIDNLNTYEMVELFNVLVVLGWFLVFIVTGILFVRWMMRAQTASAMLSSGELEYSKWSTVVWWFVPFMNFYKPKRVIDEIYDAAHVYSPALETGSHDNSITTWWALWLCQTIGNSVLTRTMNDASPALYNSGQIGICLLQIAAAIYCVKVIDEITELQRARSNSVMVEEVFA